MAAAASEEAEKKRAEEEKNRRENSEAQEEARKRLLKRNAEILNKKLEAKKNEKEAAAEAEERKLALAMMAKAKLGLKEPQADQSRLTGATTAMKKRIEENEKDRTTNQWLKLAGKPANLLVNPILTQRLAVPTWKQM